MEQDAFEYIAKLRDAIRNKYLKHEPKESMPHWIAALYREADELLDTRDAMNGMMDDDMGYPNDE